MVVQQLKLKEYHRLKDIIQRQQEFHYNLGGYHSDRFLSVGVDEFTQFMCSGIDGCVFFIEVDAQIIGFAAVTLNKDNEAFIEDIFIDAPERGKGYGYLLMDEILSWAKNKQANFIDVHITNGNEKVFFFYNKFGLQKTGYTMRVYSDEIQLKNHSRKQ